MTTTDAPPALHPEADAASEADAATGSYDAVRFNAVKHGILSRHIVLPHEDAEEFAELRTALEQEHAPAGATEQHLVEELAAIMWRKRRVLQAEGAAINRGLRSVASSSLDSPIPAAAPFEHGLSGAGSDLRDLMTATAEDLEDRRRFAELDLKATWKAESILQRTGDAGYEKARKALLRESRDWWDESVAEGEFEAEAESLLTFISEQLEPACLRQQAEARLLPAIRNQTLGEGLQAHRLEKLTRYETHLDRKFERILAMLVKLKQLRATE